IRFGIGATSGMRPKYLRMRLRPVNDLGMPDYLQFGPAGTAGLLRTSAATPRRRARRHEGGQKCAACRDAAGPFPAASRTASYRCSPAGEQAPAGCEPDRASALFELHSGTSLLELRFDGLG